jgi:adenylate cyclase
MLVFITALALCLIVIQVLALHAAAKEAASAYMDAAAAATETRLQSQVANLRALVRVLSKSPFLADSDDRSEVGGAVDLFKTALQEEPQADSFYVGYDNSCWLQVRGLDSLDRTQRARLEAPPGAVFNVNLVRPLPEGALPMRRVFEDADGNKIGQIDLWNYGYNVRQRTWYQDTMAARRSLVSPPYLSFSLATPQITLSAPLRGKVHGVIAADLKLDKFSEFVQEQRPGKHGTVIMFDASGALIAHPEFARLAERSLTHPGEPQIPNIREIKRGLVSTVMRGWDHSGAYEGSAKDGEGNEFLFRLSEFNLGDERKAYLLLLAAEDDFVDNVRQLQLKGLIVAIFVGGCFVPIVWFFGAGMSRALKRITDQTERLRGLAEPDETTITSHITEIHELSSAMALAQRTIWSFAHFVPKEIVRGIIDGSISTRLGGVRQEVSILFTDVRDFTGLAERADPDILMHQASRHFTVLTAAFLAEGGTVDKFIGDAVMVFWNAPHPQTDHVERACRAALAAKAASERLNGDFDSEGLPPFVVRFGLHVGDAVVGNLGSAERMEYTALGSSVNLAARLEGLNKEYGTTILVSDAVRLRVEHRFHFRPIASVIAKGMTMETRVFELVNESRGI